MQTRTMDSYPGRGGATGIFVDCMLPLHAPSLIGPATTRASAGALMTRGGLSCSEVFVFGWFLVCF